MIATTNKDRSSGGGKRSSGGGKRSSGGKRRQLSLALVRGRGGPGRGQGRKKTRFDYVPHTTRSFLDKRHPVHISTRVVPGLPSLRGRRLWSAVRRGFAFGCVYGGSADAPRHARFRIVHFSVQGQHVHLLCEAADRSWLARGVQGFKVRVAKAINRALGRRGAVFTDRYHARIVTSPTQCRHTLSYVLSNQRHHAYAERASYPAGRVDPFSSALAFGGWSVARARTWANAPPTPWDHIAPVAPPSSWLLRGGWRRGGGPISPSRVPGLPQGAPALPVW